jgi:hypothetical protein
MRTPSTVAPHHQLQRIIGRSLDIVQFPPPLRQALQWPEGTGPRSTNRKLPASGVFGLPPGCVNQCLREGDRTCMNWIDVHTCLTAGKHAPDVRRCVGIAVLGISRLA